MALPAAASVVTGGLSGYPSVYFDRVAVKSLFKNLALYDACEQRPMPPNSGVTLQILGYTPFGANVTPATEGTPGTGQALTQVTRQIALDQFVDWITLSDKSILTALTDTLSDAATQLAYRGALSVDTVIASVMDTAANADSTSRDDVVHSTFMTVGRARRNVASLQNNDVQPKSNGRYYGVIHPMQKFDFVNDSNAGGFIDLMKYTESNAGRLQEGVKNNFIGVIDGVEWYMSSALPTETNWQSLGSNAYHAFIVGQDAFFASQLKKTPLNQRGFQVMTNVYSAGSQSSDPGGQIRASVAYNFFFGVAKRPGSVSAFRRIRSESSLG
jgi:N4-gp56 family major capsid protein